MASPVPAKSQPLHNFSLPNHLTWKKNHNSTAATAADHHHHHHRSRTRLSTPPPASPTPPATAQPSSSSNPRRPSPHFDPPRRQSSPSNTFGSGAHVSRRHSPLLDSLSKQSPLRESESESDFRRQRSPASASRRQTSPSYAGRRQSPLLDSTISKQSPMRDSESESDFTSATATAAAAHKSPPPEYPRSDLPVLPSDETKSTQTDPKFSLAHEKGKRSKISIRFGKNKLEETTPNEDSTAAEAASADAAAAEDEESVPKTWNLRPRRPTNKQSNGIGTSGVHKLGGSLSKELRSAMNNSEAVGINPVEKKEKEKKLEFTISASLNRREIEEDIYALTGSKPSRRPKKRNKTAQRHIEIFHVQENFNPQKKMDCRKFELTFISAFDLENVRHFGKMKVYAKVTIGSDPKTEKRTQIDKHGETNPAWNHTMRYTIGESSVDHHGARIVIKLYCKRKLGDRYVGEVHASVKELYDYAFPGGGSALVTYPVQRGCANSQGLLKFSYRFGERVSVEKLLLAESIAVLSTCAD